MLPSLSRVIYTIVLRFAYVMLCGPNRTRRFLKRGTPISRHAGLARARTLPHHQYDTPSLKMPPRESPFSPPAPPAPFPRRPRPPPPPRTPCPRRQPTICKPSSPSIISWKDSDSGRGLVGIMAVDGIGMGEAPCHRVMLFVLCSQLYRGARRSSATAGQGGWLSMGRTEWGIFGKAMGKGRPHATKCTFFFTLFCVLCGATIEELAHHSSAAPGQDGGCRCAWVDWDGTTMREAPCQEPSCCAVVRALSRSYRSS